LIDSPIIKYNRLVRIDSDIWVNKDKSNDDFVYSDGDNSEKYIKEVLQVTDDLSSDSLELDTKWIDWPSEYHLSSRRANLLRAIDLKDVRTALEVGSGCGAITRYLGEMGIRVDAVEGSRRRAEITRLRCRDLDGINVICENYNSLDISKKTYDAVFLIGILEYAERFSPSSTSHQHAVANILEKAKEALTDDGIILIAIENRLGFKYLFGASEDHYGVQHIGVYGYPEYQSRITDRKKGIRTYDKREWEEILSKLNGLCYEYFYPFPDYKLPQVVLSDRFAGTDKYAFSNLSRINSRDYKHFWSPCIDENLFWETAAGSGYLNTSSNSYAIVLAKSKERIEIAINFDFMHFPNPKRKPGYRTITVKPRGTEVIFKKQNTVNQKDSGTGIFFHRPGKEKYFQGHLLSDVWIRALKVFDEPSVFEGLIEKYYHFLVKYFQENKDKSMLIDLIPFNIIVDRKGRYNSFDLEWKTVEPISPEFVFFRSTLYFGCIQKKCLAPLFRTKNINTIYDFVDYCFNIVSVNVSKHLPKFIDQENRFQAHVLLPSIYKSVEERLALHVFEEEPIQCMAFYPKVYWTGEDGVFREELSVTLSAMLGVDRKKLVFVLPSSSTPPKKIRFDPADHTLAGPNKLFHLFMVTLLWRTGDGNDQIVWQLKDHEEIIRDGEMEGLYEKELESGAAFLVTSNDPQIIFDIPENIQRPCPGRYIVEVEINWPDD